MNKVDIAVLAFVLHEIEKEEIRLLSYQLGGSGGHTLRADVADSISIRLAEAEAWFKTAKMPEGLHDIETAKYGLKRPLIDNSTAYSILNRLHGDIMKSLGYKSFLLLDGDKGGYIDNESLLGSEVFNAFPSAQFDIKESGNCLACGTYSAAGFHLMRAAEVGLWELGKDRQIPLAQAGKIEFSEWGDIIRQLETAV